MPLCRVRFLSTGVSVNNHDYETVAICRGGFAEACGGCHYEHLAMLCAGSITEPVMEDRTRREDTTFLRPPFYIVRFIDLRFNCSQRKKNVSDMAPHTSVGTALQGEHAIS